MHAQPSGRSAASANQPVARTAARGAPAMPRQSPACNPRLKGPLSAPPSMLLAFLTILCWQPTLCDLMASNVNSADFTDFVFSCSPACFKEAIPNEELGVAYLYVDKRCASEEGGIIGCRGDLPEMMCRFCRTKPPFEDEGTNVQCPDCVYDAFDLPGRPGCRYGPNGAEGNCPPPPVQPPPPQSPPPQPSAPPMTPPLPPLLPPPPTEPPPPVSPPGAPTPAPPPPQPPAPSLPSPPDPNSLVTLVKSLNRQEGYGPGASAIRDDAGGETLLDSTEQEAAATKHRLPQLLLFVAALMLVAAGLGVVVWLRAKPFVQKHMCKAAALGKAVVSTIHGKASEKERKNRLGFEERVGEDEEEGQPPKKAAWGGPKAAVMKVAHSARESDDCLATELVAAADEGDGYYEGEIRNSDGCDDATPDAAASLTSQRRRGGDGRKRKGEKSKSKTKKKGEQNQQLLLRSDDKQDAGGDDADEGR